jgi:hypothetical protein
MNPAAPLFGLVRAVRWTLGGVLRALSGPDLEAGAQRNAWNAMTEITTRRRNYAKARAALVAEEDRLRAALPSQGHPVRRA